MRKLTYIFLALILICPLSSASITQSSMCKLSNAVQLLLPFSALIISGAKNDKEGLKQFAYTGLITSAVMLSTKYIVKAKRPNGGKYSFPSGHSSIAFASSTYMWKRYGAIYGVPASLIAGFVGYSRVKTKNHYTRDVVAGAALGIGVGLLMTTTFQQNILIAPGNISLNFTF